MPDCIPRTASGRTGSCRARSTPAGGGLFDIEYRTVGLRVGGALRWIRATGRASFNDAGQAVRFIGTVQDITKRKQAEEALRRSEGRWNAAIESFSEGAIIATEDEQVIYWNPAARAMHGFTSETEGIGPLRETPITFELWTPDGCHLLELDEWPMRRLKRGEIVRNLELRVRRPDQGWEKVFSYSGAMVETAGGERLIFLSVYDLTNQRKAEGALRESEDRLRFALETIQTGAWDLDLTDHTAFRSIEHDPHLRLRRIAAAVDLRDVPRTRSAGRPGGGGRPIPARDGQPGGIGISSAASAAWMAKSAGFWPRGRHRPDDAGVLRRMAGVVQDITERKRGGSGGFTPRRRARSGV